MRLGSAASIRSKIHCAANPALFSDRTSQSMNLDETEADIEDSKTVVRICTEFAPRTA